MVNLLEVVKGLSFLVRLNLLILSITVLSKLGLKLLLSKEFVSQSFHFLSSFLEADEHSTVISCRGIFFYNTDNAEVDIELLSSYYDKGYKQYLDAGVQYTNQALVEGQDSTSIGQPYGFDPTQDFHK